MKTLSGATIHFVIIFLFSFITVKAQTGVSINTTNAAAHSSAMLDVTSTSKGALFPRMTSSQRSAISSPAASLTVYDTDSNSYYVYNSGWKRLAPAMGTATGQTMRYNGTDWVKNTFMSNSNSTVAIGTSSPYTAYKLDVVGNVSLKDHLTFNSLTGILNFGASNASGGFFQVRKITTTVGSASFSSSYQGIFTIYYNNGNMLIGTTGTNSRKVEVLDVGGTPQVRILYNTSNYTDFQTGTTGYMSILPTGSGVAIGSGSTAVRKFEVIDGGGNAQVRLLYNSSNYTELKTSSAGYLTIVPTGSGVSIGSGSTAARRFEVIDGGGNAQARLLYNSSNYTELQTTSSGNLVIAPTGSSVLMGTTSASSAGAIFELSSTTKAFLASRMTKVQRNAITSQAAGMVTYQTDNTQGLRVYNGTNWVKYTETAD